jgi:2-polyprenyl-3-methyl-5-hydroxy-6-metoxy-1,4-benzoquinol methylase
MFPGIKVYGIDLNTRRIEIAVSAAKRLGTSNVEFSVGNAVDFVCSHAIEAAYMLDLVHHIPKNAVMPLVRELVANLVPNARLIIKDVDSRPFHKMVFTWLLDKAMDCRAQVHYWPAADLQELLVATGLQVHRHAMVDYLPYPHMIYIATKQRI